MGRDVLVIAYFFLTRIVVYFNIIFNPLCSEGETQGRTVITGGEEGTEPLA